MRWLVTLGLTLAMVGVLGQPTPTLASSLSDSGLSDAEIERVLRRGKIKESRDVGIGVTKPIRLWLELDGVSASACYKNVDIDRKGLTRLAGGEVEANFTDSYRYERAAYLLDRYLELDAVPVCVLRELWRKEGAVCLWIGDSITEKQRLERGLYPDDPAVMIEQQADMRLFDALIYNVDRHAGNQLFTLDDWRLHLIDHSRGFRRREGIPEEFESRPMTISRSTLAKLEELDQPSLRKLLKRALGPRQIDDILVRRDLILAKLERDRREYGDAFVFREERRDP